MTELTWHPVERFDLKKDLLPLLHYLNQQRIHTHVTEEQGMQQLWVLERDQIPTIKATITAWLSGDLSLTNPETAGARINKAHWLLLLVFGLRRQPITVILLVLAVIGYGLVALDTLYLQYAQPLLFQPIYQGELLPPLAGWKAGHYWRLLTPIFLHFGAVHIIFNGLFLWLLGRKLEIAKGGLTLLLTVVIIGVVSNLAQYWVTPNIYFGGMSGVVYGLLGYIAVYQRFIPNTLISFYPVAIVVFIVMLLLGITGVMDIFVPGEGSIANTTHIVGLLCGAFIGGVSVIFDRHLISKKD